MGAWSTIREIVAQRLTVDPRWPNHQRVPQTIRTVAGVPVTPDTAVTVPAVWACLRFLSQSVAVLPWHVMRETARGGELFSAHPVDWLIYKRPNPEWSAFQFRETLTHWALRWGNGYAEIERGGAGLPVALWPIHPERVWPMRDPDTGALFYRVHNGSSPPTELDPSDMFHIRGFGEDVVGVNVMAYAAESIGWARAALLFGAGFFGQGMNPAGVIEIQGQLKPGAWAKMKAEFKQLYRGPRGERVMFLDQKATYKPITIEPDKAQFVATNQHLIEEVCFLPGTEVLTPAGTVAIETIRPGALVLTHKGRWRPVKHVMRRDYVGRVVRLRAKGLSEVVATANHPFYAQRITSTRSHKLVADGRPDWIAAGDLRAGRRQADGRRGRGGFDALTMPRMAVSDHASIDIANWGPELAVKDGASVKASTNGRATSVNRFIPMDYDLGWICGVYAAEGSVSDHQAIFYLGSHEKEITAALHERISRVFGLAATVRTAGNCDRTVISNRIIPKFFAEFGRSSEQKKLPAWTMESGSDFRRGMIDGLVDGDGCIYRERSMVRTTSTTLAWQTRMLLWSLGVNTTMQTAEAGVWAINGRSGTSLPMHTVEWRHENQRRGSMGTADGHVYFNLDQADHEQYSGAVFNLEVEEDESYTTVGGCCHNCRWFGVPPHKVAHLLRATFSNIEQQGIEAVVDSIMPWVKRFEEEADFKLFGQNRQSLYTKMNVNALMRGDSAARALFYQTMRQQGVYSANDILRMEDMNTIPASEGGDIRVMQGQYMPLSEIAKATVSAPAAPKPPPPEQQQLANFLSRELAQMDLEDA